VPYVRSLAQVRAGSLSEGFLLPERKLFSLSEIDRVDCIRVCFTCLNDLCFKQFKYDAMCALYDILGFELMRLV